MPNNPTYDEVGDRTIDLLGLADVKRWTVIRTHRNQSVAEHAFAVAIISVDLYTRMNYALDQFGLGQLVWWSLVHDAPETISGDIDGKFKRSHPEVRKAVCEAENKEFPWFEMMAQSIQEPVRAIVKLADRIEALRFIKDHGYGARADDVYQENWKSLFEDVVPWAAGVLGLPVEEVEAAVRFTFNHSTSESNSIQMRRHRRDGTAE